MKTSLDWSGTSFPVEAFLRSDWFKEKSKKKSEDRVTEKYGTPFVGFGYVLASSEEDEERNVYGACQFRTFGYEMMAPHHAPSALFSLSRGRALSLPRSLFTCFVPFFVLQTPFLFAALQPRVQERKAEIGFSPQTT